MDRDRPRTNIERLNEEGFEIDTQLPQEYADVIEELRPGEIEVLIDVVRRLERAKKCIQGEPDFRTYMPTF
jgi:hypothetical protein